MYRAQQIPEAFSSNGKCSKNNALKVMGYIFLLTVDSKAMLHILSK